MTQEPSMLLLTAAALLPALIVLIFVYRQDKVEKEPVGLLIKLLLAGALSGVAAYFIEIAATFVLDLLPLYEDSLLYVALDAFVVVALSEEFVKRKATTLVSWKDPAFDYRFDAVVYAVTATLGFAALENWLYVVGEGTLDIALSRALLSIPGHATDGVFMGIYLGEAKLCERYHDAAGKKHYMRLSLLIPVLLHGFYDFCLMYGTDLTVLIFFAFVIVMDIVVIVRLRRASKRDTRVKPTVYDERNDVSAAELSRGLGTQPYTAPQQPYAAPQQNGGFTADDIISRLSDGDLSDDYDKDKK